VFQFPIFVENRNNDIPRSQNEQQALVGNESVCETRKLAEESILISELHFGTIR